MPLSSNAGPRADAERRAAAQARDAAHRRMLRWAAFMPQPPPAPATEPEPYEQVAGEWRAIRTRCSNGRAPNGDDVGPRQLLVEFNATGTFRLVSVFGRCRVERLGTFQQMGGLIETQVMVGETGGACQDTALDAERPRFEMWSGTLIRPLDRRTGRCGPGADAAIEFARVSVP